MYKIILRAISLLLVPAMLLTAAVGAWASEADPSADLNAETGVDSNAEANGDSGYDSDIQSGSSGAVDAEGRIWVTSNMEYDTLSRDFVYSMGGSENEFHATVADGMVVSGPVRLNGAGLMVYNSGEEYTGDLTEITEPGEYVVTARTGSSNARLLTFTILGKTTNAIHTYTVPDGMMVVSATRDNEAVDFTRYAVPMEEDGAYHIEYECSATGVTYVLDATIDRTPPDVRFSGHIDENNRVHSALAFSNLKEDEHISVTLDGNPIDVTVNNDGTGELLDSGSYVIRAYDDAGNIIEYGYIIMIYLNSSSIVFFALLAATLVGVALYIIIKRKKLKIG